MFERLRHWLFYAGRQGDDGINLRRWFVFFVVYLAVLAAAALLSLHGYAQGHLALLRVWLVALYLFYMSLCCSFFPAPTAWLVLLMASPGVNLIDPARTAELLNLGREQGGIVAAVLTVVIVGALGGLGTALANLNEYHIFTFLLRLGRVNKVRQTAIYRTASRWFAAAPFALMTFVSLLPIPVDVVRWLAITYRYRRDHYALSSFLGRFVRYGLLAGAAACFRLGWRGIIAIQLALVVLVLLRYLPRLLNHWKKDRVSNPTLFPQGSPR